MKKSLIILVVIVFGLAFSLTFFGGCAKKTTVKEESATKEQAVAEKGGAKTGPAVKEEPTMAASEEETAMAKREKIFVDIHFDYDRYSLKSDAREILKKQAAWLANHGTASIIIEGNCDERGTTEYNLALGERRAKEAMKYLIELGIDGKRLKTVSYGKERPLDPEHNEEAWAKNRRDHFVLSFKK
jgi:peptidoglycan-associated lipoprotein